jgi:hypothetical protein
VTRPPLHAHDVVAAAPLGLDLALVVAVENLVGVPVAEFSERLAHKGSRVEGTDRVRALAVLPHEGLGMEDGGRRVRSAAS